MTQIGELDDPEDMWQRLSHFEQLFDRRDNPYAAWEAYRILMFQLDEEHKQSEDETNNGSASDNANGDTQPSESQR